MPVTYGVVVVNYFRGDSSKEGYEAEMSVVCNRR